MQFYRFFCRLSVRAEIQQKISLMPLCWHQLFSPALPTCC